MRTRRRRQSFRNFILLIFQAFTWTFLIKCSSLQLIFVNFNYFQLNDWISDYMLINVGGILEAMWSVFHYWKKTCKNLSGEFPEENPEKTLGGFLEIIPVRISEGILWFFFLMKPLEKFPLQSLQIPSEICPGHELLQRFLGEFL